jgi:hypothetical protein
MLKRAAQPQLSLAGQKALDDYATAERRRLHGYDHMICDTGSVTGWRRWCRYTGWPRLWAMTLWTPP